MIIKLPILNLILVILILNEMIMQIKLIVLNHHLFIELQNNV